MNIIRNLFVVLAAVAPAVAQPQSPPPVTTVHQEIVVTASAAPETEQSVPAAVTVITRSDIERLAARDVADVLRLVPGLNVSRSGSPGKIASLFTRGGSSKQTLVLWNGLELNNPYFSGFDWGRFSTAGVDRVEVVRGPFSALYGSDAVSGVVQILTRPVASFLNVDVQGGERGLLNGRLEGASRAGALRFAGSLESRADDGFAPNDDHEQAAAQAEVRWEPATGFSIGARGRFLQYDVGIPRSVNAEGTAFELRPDRREEGEELEIAIPLRAEIRGGAYELTLSRLDRSDEFRDPEDPFGRNHAVTEVEVLRGALIANYRLGEHVLSVGGEWEEAVVDDWTNFGPSLDSEERQGEGVFLEDAVSVPFAGGVLEANAGIRYDRFETFGSEISPRAAVAFRFGSNKVRAGYGEAFRAPAVGELFIPFFGNASLEPERSANVELGYDRMYARGKVSLTLFRNDFDELIVYDNRTNRFENTGAGESRGMELGWEQHVLPTVALAISYTYLDTEDADTGLPFLRRPEHSGSLWVRWSDFGWSASAAIVHAGERADVTDLFPWGRVLADPFTTADLVVERPLAEGVTPYVKIENVTDEEYEEIFGYPSPGRRAIAGIRVTMR